jgi:hypothetical protein
MIAEVETLALRGSGSTDPVALRRIETLVSRLKSYPRTADKPQSVLDWAKVLLALGSTDATVDPTQSDASSCTIA